MKKESGPVHPTLRLQDFITIPSGSTALPLWTGILKPISEATGNHQELKFPKGLKGIITGSIKIFLMDKFTPSNIGRKLMGWNVIVMFIFLLNMSRIAKRNIRYCTCFTVGVRMKTAGQTRVMYVTSWNVSYTHLTLHTNRE